MTPSRWLLNALALFGGALLVRALPAAHVLSQGIVFFRGPDSYYHMRRIVYTIQNFPEILVSDPYVQFPHNAQPIWPPLFDWVSAALLLPFAGGGNWLRVEQAAAWIPPILGAITAVATWSVGRRLFDDRAAFGAGALLCILGGHFTYSRVGALDHHVAVALVTTLLLGATLAALGRDSARRVLRSAAAVGVWIAVSLLIWPGSLLYAAISLIGLAGIALIASDAKQAALRWHALATASGCAALLIAPFCFGNEWLHYSSMSPLVLTDFQPWFLGTTAAVGLGTALLSERPALATRSLARAGVAVGIGTVLLGTSLLLSSDLIEGVGEAWRWLSKSEAFQASVIESQGLFFVNGRFTTFMAHLQLSYFVYVFPVFWVLLLVDARHRERRAPLLFLLGWSAVLFGVTLLQKRFLDTFSVAFALVTAAGIQLIWHHFRLASRDTLGRLAFLGVLILLSPLAGNYLPEIEINAQRFAGKPLELNSWEVSKRHRLEAARWLRAFTPHTRGWYDASQQPEYAVLAPWPLGHMIQYVARRPTIADNFGDDVGEENFQRERHFWRLSVPKATETADDLGARYILARAREVPKTPFSFATIFNALFRRDGSALELPNKGRIPAASRFRLVFESRPLGNNTVPYLKIFEVVKGARLRGRTRPGNTIDLSLAVTTNRDRHFDYRDRTVAGRDGWFEFLAPYPTRDAPKWFDVAPSYALTCNGNQTRVRVPEARVKRGEVIPVADPCSG